MTRHDLLNKIFAAGESYKAEEMNEVEAEVLNYLKELGQDYQVSEALRIIKTTAEEFRNNDFEACYEIAAPILTRLSSEEKWDFHDLSILGVAVGYTRNYEHTQNLMERALVQLEECGDDDWCINVKLALYTNASLRMLRAKYFEMDNLESPKELEQLFNHYSEASIALSEQLNKPVPKALTTIRKGVFYRDTVLVEKGFEALKKTGAIEVYRTVEEAVAEYDYYNELTISKRQFNMIIGENLKKERLAHDMKQDEVAKILGVTIPAIGLMERGERSVTSRNLGKLSYIFDVPIDSFYNGIGSRNTTIKPRTKQQKLAVLAKGLSDYEIDYLLAVIKNLPQPRPS